MRPGAALDETLPNCSVTSLQYLYRHWITSFQTVAVIHRLAQIFALSKQNHVARCMSDRTMMRNGTKVSKASASFTIQSASASDIQSGTAGPTPSARLPDAGRDM